MGELGDYVRQLLRGGGGAASGAEGRKGDRQSGGRIGDERRASGPGSGTDCGGTERAAGNRGEELLRRLSTAPSGRWEMSSICRSRERLWLRTSLFDSFRRLDILQELIDDKDVSEVMVNGAGRVFVERKGRVELWNRRFEGEEQLEDIIQQIVSRVNRTVNVASPIVDARLEDGSRVECRAPAHRLDGPR